MNSLKIVVTWIVLNIGVTYSWAQSPKHTFFCESVTATDIRQKWHSASTEEKLELLMLYIKSAESYILAQDMRFDITFYEGGEFANLKLRQSDGVTRGYTKGDTIFLYPEAMVSLDYAVSTYLHEHTAHYCPFVNRGRVEHPIEEIYEEWIHRGDDPEMDLLLFDDLPESVDSLLGYQAVPTLDYLKEQVNAYRLELDLHEVGIIQLSNEQYLSIQDSWLNARTALVARERR